MADVVTQTIHHSAGDRVRNSCRGMVCGPILIVLSTILLFWNEGRTLHRKQDLNEVSSKVQTVDSPDDPLNPDLEGKLVYVTGILTTDGPLFDDLFGVESEALKLRRVVETYQWVETERRETQRNSDGSSDTTIYYTYSKSWQPRLIDSSKFHNSTFRDNPTMAKFSAQSWVADPIHLGSSYVLSEDVTRLLNTFTTLDRLDVNSIPEDSTAMGAVENGGYFCYGVNPGVPANPSFPEVGDTRVSFQYVASKIIISLIARQSGNSFTPYSSSRGGEVLLMERGTVPADEMILHAQQANVAVMWFLRALGGLLLFAGLKFALEPLALMTNAIPVIGPLLSNFVECGVSLLAMGLTVVWGAFVVALAWLFYRPLLGSLFLLVVAGIVGGAVYWAKKRQEGKPQYNPAPSGAEAESLEMT